MLEVVMLAMMAHMVVLGMETENAGLENDGPSKNRGGVENADWNLADQIAGLENAGLENVGLENAGSENAGQTF